MKPIQWLLIVGALILFDSCSKKDYMLYDRNAKNHIYFAADTVRYNFGFNPDREIDMQCLVKLIGFVQTEHSATIALRAVEGNAKTPTQYELKNVQFEKDSAICHVGIDIHRDALVKDQLYRVILELTENETYSPTQRTRCVVEFSDGALSQPKWWKPEKLGIYSQEKHLMFVDLFHQTEQKSAVIHKKVVADFGENLEKNYIRWSTDYTYTLLTIAAYTDYFRRYVLEPMYAHYVETQDARYEMPDPNL